MKSSRSSHTTSTHVNTDRLRTSSKRSVYRVGRDPYVYNYIYNCTFINVFLHDAAVYLYYMYIHTHTHTYSGFSTMSCFGGVSEEELIQKRKNKEINEQLKKDRLEYKATHRLLLLGISLLLLSPTPDSIHLNLLALMLSQSPPHHHHSLPCSLSLSYYNF